MKQRNNTGGLEEILSKITDWCFGHIHFAGEAERGEISPRSSRRQNMYSFFAIRGEWGKFHTGLGKLANKDSEFEFQSVYAYTKQ